MPLIHLTEIVYKQYTGTPGLNLTPKLKKYIQSQGPNREWPTPAQKDFQQVFKINCCEAVHVLQKKIKNK